MKTVTIQPSSLHGTITAAASKSSMQRACAAALLSGGETILINPGKSNDDLAATDVIQKLGATVTETDGKMIIASKGIKPLNNEVNCGESGLGIRMFTPIAALSDEPITLTGSGSLLTRPMDFFDEILPQLGVKVRSQNGKLPLQIQGPLQPADIEVDGSLSSQFLTGLLMAYGAAGANGVTITVKDLKSKPYIDLTLQVMKHFGWEVQNDRYERFTFSNPKANEELTRTYTVEGDWSGAAFLLVAGAIAGPITVNGLDVFSTQADRAVLSALSDCGCRLSITPGEISIGPMPSLKAFHFNANDCPDLFPPLVALAACCDGTTVIEGVHRLTHKESNRALTLQQEFAKLGIEITLQNNLMLVRGGVQVTAAVTHSHHDHRIAMACAVAGLRANGAVVIEEADAINKSYPTFYEHLKLLGAQIQ